MKKYIKVLLTLCIVLGMLTTTAYAAEAESKPFEYEDEQIIETVQSILTEVNAFSTDELDYYAQNSLGITKAVCEDFLKLKNNDTLGGFKEFKDSNIANTQNAVVVTITAVYEKTELTMVAVYKEIRTGSTTQPAQIVPTSVEIQVDGKAVTERGDLTADVADTGQEETSTLDTLKNAALNTIMGICIVVLMLTLISFLISLFKYIPKLQEKYAKSKENRHIQTTAVDNAVARIEVKEEKEEQELVDDTELVAVITAAICAATNTSGDSFVVRSIRKARYRI